MKRIRKRDLLARIESIEERLARPVPAPLPGQQTIPGATAHEDPDPHPRYEDYPTTRAYEEAFHLWRARQRDHLLNEQERAAQWDIIETALRTRSGAPGL